MREINKYLATAALSTIALVGTTFVHADETAFMQALQTSSEIKNSSVDITVTTGNIEQRNYGLGIQDMAVGSCAGGSRSVIDTTTCRIHVSTGNIQQRNYGLGRQTMHIGSAG